MTKTYDVKSVTVSFEGREVTGFSAPADKVLVAGAPDEVDLQNHILRDRVLYGGAVVLVSEGAPPRVVPPHQKEVRLALVDDPEALPAPTPTAPYQPMNRHARRKAAALARKGRGR